MRRIAYMVLRNLFYMPVWFYRIWRMGRADDTHTDQERYDYLRKRTIKAVKDGNIIIQTTGAESLPSGEGFILFPNHQGLFDIVALIATCPYPIRAVAKKEVSDIIFVKQVMELLHCIPIDRSDIKSSLEIINTMAENVKKGKNYLIFAEGTRSRDGNNILPFKAGTFKSAMKARCPIVPVALIDSFKPFDVPSIKKETVQVHFLNPIPYEQYVGLKTKEIADMVHDQIQRKIDENILKNTLDKEILI